ncbi:response regulator [Oligoflexus tunisiensis]|uniref:response regulator n=1 Tax=Oligoflexus tunisiensis TaxID=708132 RepID=UPI00114CCE76|nr:response regulator [Oligoflexus tunisiensis]
MRALIVDDSPKVRSELRHLLGRLGWNIVGEAVNGVEALELVAELRPDLITLDIIMPEMDGIECYRELRKLSQPPRCLLISVLATEPRVVAAYGHEILSSHFLKKPVLEKDLRAKLEEVMAMPPLPYPPPSELPGGMEPEALNPGE